MRRALQFSKRELAKIIGGGGAGKARHWSLQYLTLVLSLQLINIRKIHAITKMNTIKNTMDE
jgi:hypothetical protein